MKIIVLGGGSNQVPLIKKAKQMGCYVILIDYLKECAGKEFSDLHLMISTFDVNGVYEAAKTHNVCGIITVGTDQPVLTAAVVSEKLGLDFYIDAQTALNVTNKVYMKKIFRENNIPCVDYRFVKADFSKNELDGLKFPVVLKPVDSQGQRGIFKLNNLDEVRKNIENTLSFSREYVALVEEYYENDEITVNGWAKDGEFKLLSIVDRVTMRDCIGVCIAHNAQSVYNDKYLSEIKSITSDIINAFNIKNGPIYFQYLVGKEGILVNEIAMRVGGAYEGITIPIIADVDILKLIVEYPIKKNTLDLKKIDYNSKNTKFVSTQLFFCEPGEISSIVGIDKITKMDFVTDMYLEYINGDIIKKTEDATTRAGYFIVTGNSFDDMIKNVDKVFNTMKIYDKDSKNLIKKYSDYKNKYLNF